MRGVLVGCALLLLGTLLGFVLGRVTVRPESGERGIVDRVPGAATTTGARGPTRPGGQAGSEDRDAVTSSDTRRERERVRTTRREPVVRTVPVNLDQLVRETYAEEARDAGLDGVVIEDLELLAGRRALGAMLEREVSEFEDRARETAVVVTSWLLFRRENPGWPELTDPVEAVLRVIRSGRVNLAHLQDDSGTDVPLTPELPEPSADGPNGVAWRGGLVPLDRVLLIHRIELRALPGSSVGHLALEVPWLEATREFMEFDGVPAPFRATFRGRRFVWPSTETLLALRASELNAEAVVFGRLLDPDAVEDLDELPFALDEEGSEGVLPADVVRLQLRAGSPGSAARASIPAVRTRPPLQQVRAPFWGTVTRHDSALPIAWYEGHGTLMRGVAWRVERIVVRARAWSDGAHPGAIVRFANRELFGCVGSAPATAEQVWRGAIVVTREDRLEISCGAGSEVDVTITGSVVPEPPDEDE